MKKKLGFNYEEKWSSETDNGLAQTPKKTIIKNLLRSEPLINNILYKNNIPLPTWIELSIIDACNRTCVFCPKSNDSIAPNTYQQIEESFVKKLKDDLIEMGFKGVINICGYGEPMLHKKINYIVKELSQVASIEIVTNGDPITAKKLSELDSSGISKILFSLYDGEHQIVKFNKMIDEANISKEKIVLRDRWYSKDKDFGVKLTNRTGTVDFFTENENKDSKCFYPSYSMMIDWNGNIYLCPQDWQRRIILGNLMQKKLFDIWNGALINKYRKKLLCGNREDNPCKSCNANGTLLGSDHANVWGQIYNAN